MSRAEHTPGPWQACGHDRGGCECRMVWSLPDDVVVAAATMAPDEICCGEGIADMEIAKANARLIAAAPDLLEACERAADIEEDRYGCTCDEGGGYDAIAGGRCPLCQYRAAIAKAEESQMQTPEHPTALAAIRNSAQ